MFGVIERSKIYQVGFSVTGIVVTSTVDKSRSCRFLSGEHKNHNNQKKSRI